MNDEIKALQELNSAIKTINDTILKLKQIDPSYNVMVRKNPDAKGSESLPVLISVIKSM